MNYPEKARLLLNGSHTWPRDVLLTPKELGRRGADHLVCFLACPFEPSGKANDLLSFIQSICDEIGREVGADIQCVRSDMITTPGTIHSDIWKYLELADALIFDVTGGNGNVLLELGVAASCRSQDNIVIIRDEADTASKFLFDIAPSRHFLYSCSLMGSKTFGARIKEALIHALTPAPHKPDPTYKTSFPLEIDLVQQGDSADLLSPPMLHRRLVENGLEFGSFYFFRNSWITVGDEDHELVNLNVLMQFSDRAPNLGASEGWIGVALRSQHFFANYSHLVYVRYDGLVLHTKPLSEQEYDDVEIGYLREFQSSDLLRFDLVFGATAFAISIRNLRTGQDVSKTLDLKSKEDVPYVRHAGKIRLQTRRCRALLRSIGVNVEG